MAPVPEEHKGSTEIPTDSQQYDEERNQKRIVISGMSGLFPKCNNISDLSNILYAKENPVISDESRWTYEHPELPKHLGIIPGLDKFDAQFFKVTYRLGNQMDARCRKLLEQTYQAIYDAGVSPLDLWGKNVAVYMGTCFFSEQESNVFYESENRTTSAIAGCSKSMFANRISYWLNLKGPSICLDASCTSSMMALQYAYDAIKSGECEAAIVGGSSICLHPEPYINYGRVMPLSMDGKTKSFDKNAEGCTRSEAINVLFLQKAQDAKRIYANVCHIDNEFSPFKNESGQIYGPYRDPEKLTNFIREFYKYAEIPPTAVDYVEAYGSGVPEADKSELEAISKVMCKDKINPLLVGSVISNIGNTEAASGICSIIKVLVGYHTGRLAANLHCNSPRDDVQALKEGRMCVVTEHQHFSGNQYAAVNNMSVTGINTHLLLKGHNKSKNLSRYNCNLPYLVAVSGRQESGVHKIIDYLKTSPVDPEQIGLLHNIHEQNIPGHLGRGFVVVDKSNDGKTKCITEKTDYYDDTKRPLWFVYSGMGSQWTGMGTELMRIPIFAASMERCRKALLPTGIDIIEIITSKDPAIFDNILHSFVGISAVQIGLTDVLREMGIVPDKIVGHSAGETVCGYADGCMTLEETILSAYWRGVVSYESPFIHGKMGAVGLGYKQIKNMCPPEIDVACHNSPESSTISGPFDIMTEFMEKLTSQGIFARAVASSNIAYHSRYVKIGASALLKYLRKVLKNPKPRSDRWISTSVPEEGWNEPEAKFCSAEYYTNNMLNPVLFEEATLLVPSNAVVVELAPHGLMQAILKRSLPESCINIPLTKRGHSDSAVFMLEAIGKLYMQGYNPRIKELYPTIEYPVSSGTPFLSHLVEWAHEEVWEYPIYEATEKLSASAAKFIISLHDDEHCYLKGNVHGNETLYPFSGALVCVWDTLAMSVGMTRRNLSVQFHDIHLHEQPRLHQDKLLQLDVQLQRGNGHFEVTSENTKIVSGKIYPGTKLQFETFEEPSQPFKFVSQDIYQLFYRHGFYYSGEFKSIKFLNEEMTRANILWTGNWITLLDSMIQLNALRKNHDGVLQPQFIGRLDIDVKDHLKTHAIKTKSSGILFDANFVQTLELTRCGGVAMKNVEFQYLPSLPFEPFTLKTLKFTPFFQLKMVEVSETLNFFLQITGENINKPIINVVEVQNSETFSLQKEIEDLINDIPGLTINFQVVSFEDTFKDKEEILKTADLVVVTNINTSDNMCKKLYELLPQDIFMLNTELTNKSLVPQALYRAVASAATSRGKLVLARWRPAPIPTSSAAIFVNDASDLAMLNSTKENIAPDQRMIILSSNPLPSGLKELVQKWRQESKRNKFYVAMIDKSCNEKHLEQFPVLDLAFNVFDQDTWGGNYYANVEKQFTGKNNNITLRGSKQGDLDSLYWEEGLEPELDKVAVKVQYTGLSIRDAKRASGAAPFKAEDKINLGYGMDFSGVTERGERVMGVIRGGAASSHVAVDPSMFWPVPAHWTLEDAATVPLPYAHAFYCIGIKSQLQPTTRLLVHGATGALGLALISIALYQGCEIFATVSDMKKKRFLRKMFPNLPDDHIGNSRTEAFGDLVLHKTNGEGCHIVVCCLEGELKNVAIRCCATSGITLDTHQIACGENYQFGMSHLTEERSYVRLDFSTIFRIGNEKEMKELQLMLCEGIKRGYVRPLPRVAYKTPDVKRAFNLLATSRHRGRALLDIRGQTPCIIPRLAISPHGCHLVVSATKDNILEGKVVGALIERGAQNIILNRQHGIKDISEGYNDMQMKIWQNLGAQIKLTSINLENPDNMNDLMNDCNHLAPVEGVYLISTDICDGEQSQKSLISIITNLDTVTRKSCPKIKLFVVANENSNIGQDVCIKRSFDKLPATMLTLPRLNKFTDDAYEKPGGCTYDTAVQAIERAVRSLYPALITHTAETTRTYNLIKDLADITGINIQAQTSGNQTLENLGVDMNKSKMISEYLEKQYRLMVSPGNIPKLTISRIREYEAQLKTEKKTKTGLNVLLNYVDDDVLLANHDFVYMHTATHSPADFEGKLFNDQKYLVLVPGIEGHHNKFKSLCKRLKLPAVVLQPGLEHPHETVEEMAARLVEVLLNKAQPQKNFYLLGYSFGALVALEMAAILEKLGLVGVVYCVDASPATFSSALKSWLSEAGATDETQLQDAIVHHMCALMADISSEHLQLQLNEAQDWPHKVEAAVKALRGHVKHSSQYVRALIESAHARIEQAQRYNAERLRANPLRSLLVVLRSSYQPASIEPDLGLKRYSLRAPVVYNLNKDHSRALDDLRTTNIVNRHLDKDILDAFENRNICETYSLI